MTVTPKGNPRELRTLANFDGAGTDLLSELVKFLEQREDWLDRSINAAVRIKDVYPPTEDANDVVAAMLQSGELGQTSDFVDTAEDILGTDVEFERSTRHAELTPVLILAKLPGLRDSGHLISHMPAGRGVKTKFWAKFQEWFASRNSEYRVHIEPVFPERFYRKLLEEQSIKRVTLVRNIRPSDAAEAERKWFDEVPLGTVRTVIAPNRRKRLGRKQDVIKALDDKATRDSLLVFRDVSYDEITVTVTDHNGRDHSVNLQSGHVARPG